MTANDSVFLDKEMTPDEMEAQTSIQDQQATLRQRIEQEELVKFREEQMRAEIRARLSSEHTTSARPQETAPTAAMAPQPIIVNVTNSVNTATSSEATAIATAQMNSPALRANRPSYWIGFFLNFFIPGLGLMVIGSLGWGLAWLAFGLALIGMFQGMGVVLMWIGVAFHYRALYRQKWP